MSQAFPFAKLYVMDLAEARKADFMHYKGDLTKPVPYRPGSAQR